MSHSAQEMPFDAGRYEIRMQGHLAGRWSGWFDGLALTCDSDGTTLLEGPVVDQAALHGLLQKVRDTGLPLVSVKRIEPTRIEPTRIEPTRIEPTCIEPTRIEPTRRSRQMTTITPRTLLRASGPAAIAAGVLFIVIQFIHPHEIAANVATTRWEVTHYLTMLMAVLALIGISGMYLRQVVRTGVLGLVAYLLFAANFLAIFAWTFVEAMILPLLVPQVPQFVNDVISIPGGGTVLGDVGGLKLVNAAAGVGYLLGGLLFGVAMYRGRILARWAALLLCAGTVATILIAVIPHWAARATAIPVGIALAGLGWSLWREQRIKTPQSDAGTPLAPVGAR